MKLFLYLIFFLALSISFTGSQSFAQTEEPDPNLIQLKNSHPEIFEKLSQDGNARIIVELKTSFIPEGNLATLDKAFNQRDLIDSTQNQVIQEIGSQNAYKYRYVPLMALQTDSNSIGKIINSPFVKNIYLDKINQATLADSVPLIGADVAFTAGFDGTGQALVILDTGTDKTHPFLEDRVVSEACYSNSCPNGQTGQIGDGAAIPCSASNCNHGTHVAGIAAGNNNSFSGVAKNSDIIAIQVFSEFNDIFSCYPYAPPCIGAFDSDIIKGLERVYDLNNDFQISSANLSLGGGLYSSPCDNDPLKPAIDQLRSVNIATVIASGNDYSSIGISSPACISTAISVGATDKFDNVSSFSNSDTFLDLLAPGESIESSVLNANYEYFDGTSMATPHVTGAWAVLKQQNPSATVDEILQLLISTGEPITDLRNSVTKPRIQIDQALGLGATTPAAIANLSLDAASETQVDLTWSIPDDGGSGITLYSIFRNLNADGWLHLAILADPAADSYSDITLASGDSVTYMVRAINAIGPADPSNIPSPVVTP